MILHVQHDVEVSEGATMGAGFAEAAETNTRLLFHPRRNFGFDRLRGQDASLAFAFQAGIADHRAAPLTRRAGAGNAEETLLIADLATATAAAAGRGFAAGASGTSAGLAVLMTTVGDFLFGTENGFFEFQRDVFAKVCAALCARTAARAGAAEQVTEPEELAENIAEILKYGGVKADARACAPDSSMSEAIVQAALLRIRQDRVGFAAFLESFFRVWVVGIAVGVVLQCQLAIGTLDLQLAGAALDAQDFVIISFYVAWQSFLSSVVNSRHLLGYPAQRLQNWHFLRQTGIWFTSSTPNGASFFCLPTPWAPSPLRGCHTTRNAVEPLRYTCILRMGHFELRATFTMAGRSSRFFSL